MHLRLKPKCCCNYDKLFDPSGKKCIIGKRTPKRPWAMGLQNPHPTPTATHLLVLASLGGFGTLIPQISLCPLGPEVLVGFEEFRT